MLRSLVLASAVLAATTAASAQGDAEQGEKVFRKCKACHMVGDDAKNRVGPVLTGVIGRAAASVEDFNYSPAMEEAAAQGVEWSNGPLVWTAENVAHYLKDPKGSIPKNKMAFAGLKKDEEVANVIAYLEQFSQ